MFFWQNPQNHGKNLSKPLHNSHPKSLVFVDVPQNLPPKNGGLIHGRRPKAPEPSHVLFHGEFVVSECALAPGRLPMANLGRCWKKNLLVIVTSWFLGICWDFYFVEPFSTVSGGQQAFYILLWNTILRFITSPFWHIHLLTAMTFWPLSFTL